MMQTSSKLTSQGQVSVPVEVRRKLGLHPGSVLEWVEDNGTFRVQRAGQFTSEQIHQTLFERPAKARTTAQMKDGIRQRMRSKHARG